MPKKEDLNSLFVGLKFNLSSRFSTKQSNAKKTRSVRRAGRGRGVGGSLDRVMIYRVPRASAVLKAVFAFIFTPSPLKLIISNQDYILIYYHLC